MGVTKSRLRDMSLRSLVCGSGFLGDDNGVSDGDAYCASKVMTASAGVGADEVEGWWAWACG